MAKALTREQLQTFEQRGFVVIDDMLSADELDRYGVAVDAAVAKRSRWDKRPLKERSRYEQSFRQCINLWEDAPDVRPFTFHPRIGEIAAALLHDTVEDTETMPEELIAEFNSDIAQLVREVTDDESLSKQDRKNLQVANASKKSPRAKLLKLADKTSNLRSMAHSPPENWDTARKQEYINWAAEVVAGLKGVNPWLEERFDEALKGAQKEL